MTGAAPSALSPFTGKRSFKVWGKRDNRLIFRCADTGALFFDRATIQDETYESYYPYLASFDEERFEWELRIRRKKFRKQLRLMQRYAPGKNFADVGAGPGYLCRVAMEEGWNATAIEISPDAIRHGMERFGVTYKSLDEVTDGSFDVITCQHVLEHVIDPIGFLGALRQKLSKNGLLVIHVPHEQPLTFLIREKIRSALGRKRDTYCTLYGDIHLSGFTRESLRSFVESRGFRTIFVRGAGMWSKYYDPFFARRYMRNRDIGGLLKKSVRGAVELLGLPVGRGDWIVGYFSKAS